MFFHQARVSCASTHFHAKIMIIERLDATSQLQNLVSELDANMLWNLQEYFEAVGNMVGLSIVELVKIVSKPIPVTTPRKYQLLKFAVWTFVRAYQLEANVPDHQQNCLFDLIRSMAFGTSLMVPTWTRGQNKWF